MKTLTFESGRYVVGESDTRLNLMPNRSGDIELTQSRLFGRGDALLAVIPKAELPSVVDYLTNHIKTLTQ